LRPAITDVGWAHFNSGRRGSSTWLTEFVKANSAVETLAAMSVGPLVELVGAGLIELDGEVVSTDAELTPSAARST
jgi:hypothetical protein